MNRLVRHLAFALAALGLVSSPALAADFHEIKAAASPAGGAWYVGMGAIGKAISSKHPEIDVAIFPGGGLANPLHVDMGRSDFGIAAHAVIVAAGKGSTPEYALRYLLTENGIDPDNDVTIDWKSEHSECVAALASGQTSIALLPQPFVTVAQSKIEGLRMALDLNAEWDALDNGSALITGVIVARRAVVEENPAAVEAFLKDYAASVDWVNANTADAAALIGEYSIVDAAVAEKALPYCNIVCLMGANLLEALPGYLEVLYNASPAAVGGEMPDNSFYFA